MTKMVPISPSRAVPIEEFISENWDYFAPFEGKAEEALTQLSRQLPAGIYETIRDRLLEMMVFAGLRGKLKVRTVIDADIIVGDAMRIASGKESSTERILSTTFIEYVAPETIVEEVETNIREKIRDAGRLEKALSHARRLLSHIRIVSKASVEAMARATQLLKNHRKDAPFLGLFFEVDADAVISREKGTYDKPGVRRWTLGNAVEIVISYESGSLALVLLGAAVEVLFDALVSLLLAILKALADALMAFMDLVKALVDKTVESIQKVPQWVLYVLGFASVAALLAAILHDGFRNWLFAGLGRMRESLSSFVSGVIEMTKKMWRALKDLFVMIWNAALPVTASAAVVGGVLLRRICRLIEVSQALAARQGR